MTTYNQLQSVQALQAYYDNELRSKHLRDMLSDATRNASLTTDFSGGDLIMDTTHTKLDQKALDLLNDVAKETKIFEKIEAFSKGEKINNTEGRSVLHTALRRKAGDSLVVNGTDVVADVHAVNARIAAFTKAIREG